MRFLVDENTGVVVARWLRSQDHEVFSVYEEARGIDDNQILEKAFNENWILITSDKDFGKKVYREQRSHRGVILLRLENERSANKIDALQRSLYGRTLAGSSVVVEKRA
ncbi:MAG: DUF5615 family PIN-like protein [Leptolyngbyaceae cyanobacterium SL_5_9]|nr:DUF5615 family PIN-like protein [Leptolyngbyaceae cyanobacterium SM1_4_3]NJN57694.1 DUF5615 family PIN-like protein [Leptolyngbyaceae cyanobacterium SL_5_9]NJO72323.1 DUF5615 family PIN-like protein [Leptolyngbyaceae cyanobacterium RM1_406_9]